MAASNSWLRAQRKGDLVELAQSVGLTSYESYKKTELENALDQYLAENASRFASNPELTGYFNSRTRAMGSPVKREPRTVDDALKVARRRTTTKLPEAKLVETKPEAKLPEEVTPESDESASPLAPTTGTSTALVQTPARSIAHLTPRIPLPATPADVADVANRSAVAVRQRVSSIYQDSGITEASHATRDALSTVTSVLFCVAGFELWSIRREILASTYAFTIPAIEALGTPDYPVYATDMFLLLTSSFWSPALTWVLTSFVLPSLAGWFFNLSATSNPPVRGRPRSNAAEYVVDPLTFSIAKALVSYVVYAQGVTFYGLLSEASVERLEKSVYGGYKGILVGTAITGLVSIYDAVLRK